MMPFTIGLQSAGGCPPLGLGRQSARRAGSIRAHSSSDTSQMVSSGLVWRRFRGMADVSPCGDTSFHQPAIPASTRF
jgi:hypothetical protein